MRVSVFTAPIYNNDRMSTPFIVTKSPKSIGIAVLLTLLFGPIGLFYASISGAILMIVTPIFLALLFFAGLFSENENLLLFSSGLLIVFAITYWLINIILAVSGVKQYNKRIEEEAQKQYDLWKAEIKGSNSPNIQTSNNMSDNQYIERQDGNQEKIQSPREWLRDNPNKSINDYYSRFSK